MDKRVREISRFNVAPPCAREFPLPVRAHPHTVLSTNTSSLVYTELCKFVESVWLRVAQTDGMKTRGDATKAHYLSRTFLPKSRGGRYRNPTPTSILIVGS